MADAQLRTGVGHFAMEQFFTRILIALLTNERERIDAYQKAYREKHRAENVQYARRYYAANREQVCKKQRPRSKKTYDQNKPKIRARMDAFKAANYEHRRSIEKRALEKWLKGHPEGARSARLKSYQKHRQARIRESKRWNRAHPERRRINSRSAYKNLRASPERVENLKAYHRSYRSKRFATDLNYRLVTNLRGRISAAMRRSKKPDSSKSLIGCTIPELKKHLESLFKPGMTWDNYGRRGWHVDHIRPCAAFDFKDPKQISACFNYKNLQPLWAAENISKNSRISEKYGNSLVL